MKSRILLHPATLRYFREARGWSQKQAAQCLEKHGSQDPKNYTRVYQRIEETGITSQKSADKLAAHLGCTAEELQAEPPGTGDVGVAIWIDRFPKEQMHMGQLYPTGLAGINHLRSEIGQADRLVTHTLLKMRGESGRLDDIDLPSSDYRINRFAGKLVAVITRQQFGFDIRISAQTSRNVDLMECYRVLCAERYEMGIRWKKLTPHLDRWLRPRLETLALTASDIIEFDGMRNPPIGSIEEINVRFFGVEDSMPFAVGDSYFKDIDEAFWAYGHYARKHGLQALVSGDSTPLMLFFTNHAPFRTVAFHRLVRDAQGSYWTPPWRATFLHRLKRFIERLDEIPDSAFPDIRTLPAFFTLQADGASHE